MIIKGVEFTENGNRLPNKRGEQELRRERDSYSVFARNLKERVMALRSGAKERGFSSGSARRILRQVSEYEGGEGMGARIFLLAIVAFLVVGVLTSRKRKPDEAGK